MILIEIVNLLWLSLGLFIAGVLEAFFWKTSFFQLFNQPINPKLFGENKKWRGLISLPLANLISVWLLQEVEFFSFPPLDHFVFLSQYNFLEYGILVGFVFNLSELPNSFMKRRLNIPPGDESNPFFYVIDHLDSTYGVLILWYFYFHFPLSLVLVGLVVTPLLFMAATLARKKLGLK
jgi:hypothetical protein